MRRAIVLLAAIGCSGRASVQPTQAPLDETTLDTIAVLATGKRLPPTERAALRAKLDANPGALEAEIARLVATREFSHDVAPRLLLGYMTAAPFSFDIAILKTTKIDETVVHWRKQECKSLADVVEVAPWWAPQTTIKICKDDYRPELLRDSQGAFCNGGKGLAIGKECGCGPSLIFCADKEHQQKTLWGLRQETVNTIGYIVSHDLPLADVFTTSYSFRDADAAWVHYRDQIVNGVLDKMPDLSSWPAEGQWAERPALWPGQHAGILTDHQFAFFSDGPRDRMRSYYERAWCKSPASFGVDVDQFRTLVHGAQDLRYHGARWKELAAAPGCTTCHARLDYGMQFFLGYPDVMTAMGPTIATQTPSEEGPLYGDDIEDPRGKAKLTPHEFGKLLVAQPEFADCMIQHVTDHVFGGAPSLAAQDVLAREYKRTGRMRDLMTKALVVYARERGTLPPPATASPTTPARGDTITLGKPLVGMIEEHCQHCHEQGALGFFADLDRRPTVTRARMLAMLRLTAFDLMPKGAHRLSSPQRRAMVSDMVSALGLSADADRNARAYYAGFTGSRTHFIDASRDAIADSAAFHQTERWPWVSESMLEGDEVTLTPSAIIQFAQTAVLACKAVPASAREQCLTRALDPDLYIVP